MADMVDRNQIQGDQKGARKKVIPKGMSPFTYFLQVDPTS
jgi:hypothetical protein